MLKYAHYQTLGDSKYKFGHETFDQVGYQLFLKLFLVLNWYYQSNSNHENVFAKNNFYFTNNDDFQYSLGTCK